MDARDELDEIIEEPMDDSEIKHYLPETPILTYSNLTNYDNLEELLPDNNSYIIILYQEEPNKGHWVALLKYNDMFEYFDSYAHTIDKPLEWIPLGIRKELDQDTKHLTKLLKKSGKKYIYNKTKYQSDNPTIATCGRHCVFRILNNKENNLNCDEYKELMEKLKNKMKLNYDEIVSTFIDIV